MISKTKTRIQILKLFKNGWEIKNVGNEWKCMNFYNYSILITLITLLSIKISAPNTEKIRNFPAPKLPH